MRGMIIFEKRKNIKIFVYDIINNINTTDKITIKEFKYDSKTLVNSFYHELLNIYKTINFNDLDNIEDISELIISFTIIDNVNQREIGSLNADDYLLDVLTDIEDKILCIIPDYLLALPLLNITIIKLSYILMKIFIVIFLMFMF